MFHGRFALDPCHHGYVLPGSYWHALPQVDKLLTWLHYQRYSVVVEWWLHSLIGLYSCLIVETRILGPAFMPRLRAYSFVLQAPTNPVDLDWTQLLLTINLMLLANQWQPGGVSRPLRALTRWGIKKFYLLLSKLKFYLATGDCSTQVLLLLALINNPYEVIWLARVPLAVQL